MTIAVEIKVLLPQEMAEQLRARAVHEGKTFTQVLKEAVALKLYMAEVADKHGKLLVELDGNLREIEIR